MNLLGVRMLFKIAAAKDSGSGSQINPEEPIISFISLFLVIAIIGNPVRRY